MIERDIKLYLDSESTFTALCNKIYAIQPPKDALMIYTIIENTGGTRKQLGSRWTEERALFRITVDAGPAQLVAGRAVIEKALQLLENYRGILGGVSGANDIVVTCSAIRGWAGIAGAYRYMFDGEAKFMESKVTNP